MNISNDMNKNCTEVSSVLKVMSHPKRLMILCHLSEKPYSVGKLEELTGISQSQVSQFLKMMLYENIVEKQKDASYSIFSIKNEKVKKLLETLHHLYSQH